MRNAWKSEPIVYLETLVVIVEAFLLGFGVQVFGMLGIEFVSFGARGLCLVVYGQLSGFESRVSCWHAVQAKATVYRRVVAQDQVFGSMIVLYFSSHLHGFIALEQANLKSPGFARAMSS